MWRDRLPYNDASYDPVWAACAEAGLPVHTHSGEAPMEEYGDHTGVYLAEVVWWTVRPAWHLLFSGAFERHPDLMFVVTEAAAYWAPDMMWKWDQYMGGGHTTKKLAAMLKGKISKLPSDYFGTNIFIGASTMSKEEIRRRYVIGIDVVMWGTDYPHPEGTWPNTQAKLRADFAEVPVDDTAELLGLTAATVYGFDLDELRPIAAQDRPHARFAGPGPQPAQRPGGPRRRPGGGRRSTGCSHRARRPQRRRCGRPYRRRGHRVEPSAQRGSPGAQHLVAVEGVAGRVGRVLLDRSGGLPPRPRSGRSGRRPSAGPRGRSRRPGPRCASSIAAVSAGSQVPKAARRASVL